jgi:hypothetical protein
MKDYIKLCLLATILLVTTLSLNAFAKSKPPATTSAPWLYVKNVDISIYSWQWLKDPDAPSGYFGDAFLYNFSKPSDDDAAPFLYTKDVKGKTSWDNLTKKFFKHTDLTAKNKISDNVYASFMCNSFPFLVVHPGDGLMLDNPKNYVPKIKTITNYNGITVGQSLDRGKLHSFNFKGLMNNKTGNFELKAGQYNGYQQYLEIDGDITCEQFKDLSRSYSQIGYGLGNLSTKDNYSENWEANSFDTNGYFIVYYNRKENNYWLIAYS